MAQQQGLPDYQTFLQERQQMQATRQSQLDSLNKMASVGGQQYVVDPTNPNNIIAVSVPTQTTQDTQKLQELGAYGAATGTVVSPDSANQFLSGGSTPESASSGSTGNGPFSGLQTGTSIAQQTAQADLQAKQLSNAQAQYQATTGVTATDRSKLQTQAKQLTTIFDELKQASGQVNQGPLGNYLGGAIHSLGAMFDSGTSTAKLQQAGNQALAIAKDITGSVRGSSAASALTQAYVPQATDTPAGAQNKLSNLASIINGMYADAGLQSPLDGYGTSGTGSNQSAATGASDYLSQLGY